MKKQDLIKILEDGIARATFSAEEHKRKGEVEQYGYQLGVVNGYELALTAVKQLEDDE